MESKRGTAPSPRLFTQYPGEVDATAHMNRSSGRAAGKRSEKPGLCSEAVFDRVGIAKK